jgi:DNA polymerase III alpha subunit
LKHIFTEVNEALAPYGLSLDLSVNLKDKKNGSEVIICGKIEKVLQDFRKKPAWYLEIDDGLGKILVYVVDPVWQRYKNELSQGRIVVIKGQALQKSGAKDENIVMVAPTSIEFPVIEKGSGTNVE